jgi:hypothetical protein
MAITKLTDDKTNNKYNEVIPATEDEMDSNQLFLKKLVDKIDEGLDETNKSTVASNTTISFGDLTLTNKGAYQLTITATRDFGGKTGSQTKSTTLTLL